MELWPICAAIETLINPQMYRPIREPATGINLYMQGCISKIAATAQNESWKPTSNNQNGRQSNIKKAAIRRVFSEKLVRPDNPAKVNRENITTDRTTEADSRKKAKSKETKGSVRYVVSHYPPSLRQPSQTETKQQI